MKCYIVTFYQYDNYGTRLQNFALCQAIRNVGAEPITLMIDQPRKKIMRRFKDIFSYLPAVSIKQKLWLNNREKRYAFQEFNQQLCCLKLRYEELRQLDFSDAIAIAGSDQIWSPTHLMNNKQETDLYFLRFAPFEKRYTYAPSFGVEQIPSIMQNLYKRYIAELKCISAREKTGQTIIRNLIGKDVPILPDPVFLFSKEEWKRMLKHTDSSLPKENYIVTYFLSRQSEIVWKGIKKYAQNINAKIICIAGNYLENCHMIPTPDLFVNLIGHAEVVFTDSFHGSAFSIIMQIPFIVFRRKDVDQMTRLCMLLEKYKCNDLLITNEHQIDYGDLIKRDNKYMKEIIQNERERGLNYIEQLILGLI